jgi:hypothetical protein
MGLDDRDIVALSGAHTIGRAFKERSGTVEFGYGEVSERLRMHMIVRRYPSLRGTIG